MKPIVIGKFADLVQSGEAVIKNVINRQVVRTLSVRGSDCHILCGDGSTALVPLAEEIRYEPWDMDRGSLVFTLGGQVLKICTEFDILELPDGTQFSIQPLGAGAI